MIRDRGVGIGQTGPDVRSMVLGFLVSNSDESSPNYIRLALVE